MEITGVRGSGQGGAPAHRLNLQARVLKADGVVAVERAFALQREDPLQIPAATGHEGGSAVCRCHLKAPVEQWLPRSLYNAQNTPLRSITSFNPAIPVSVDSSSTSCA